MLSAAQALVSKLIAKVCHQRSRKGYSGPPVSRFVGRGSSP
jgi:hypothetical protein